MSRQLSRLLEHDHPLFAYNVAQLEKASGNSGIDTRLVADMLEATHSVMRGLGLDPADTSARELYQALNASVGTSQATKLLASTTYVLSELDGDVVSLCLYDVIENAHHELPFEGRVREHAKRYLRREIIARYSRHDRLDNQLVHRLSEQMGLGPFESDVHSAFDRMPDADTEPSTTSRLLMVGDIFTDAFIQLDESQVMVETDDAGKEWLKLPFGAKPAYEKVDIVRSVGPSPNAAIASARLGLDVSLMSWLGDDEPGRQSLAHLQSESVATDDLIVQPGSASSYWYVLRHGSERTMLVKSESYDYQWHQPTDAPDWLYLAYIGQDSWPLHEQLLEYLTDNPAIKFVFQPATYHFKWGTERLAGLYARADLCVMNKEEAAEVTGKSPRDIIELATALHELGPEMVVITDGAKGSYAWQDGTLMTIANYPDPAPPVDRTGAGDAFAATITAGLALGQSLETALRWAPVNSASVVQHIGAQKGLLSMDSLKQWLDNAPEDYQVKTLT